MLIARVVSLSLLIPVLCTGCAWVTDHWRGHTDQHRARLVQERNQQQYASALGAIMPPPPPAFEDSLEGSDQNLAGVGLDNGDGQISLHTAITVALDQSDLVRVAEGSQIVTGGTTFYDVNALGERYRAALASFDAQFESLLYTNQFQNPANAFFGPGLAQPELRDEAAITAALIKPLMRGGAVAAAYNPDPGYLFLPGSTSPGFNPRYVSELQLSYEQPLMRNAGLQVNIAPIQVARLEVEQSAWDLKDTLMSSVRSVVEQFWELYTSRVSVAEYEQVIPLLEEIVRVQGEAFQANQVIRADVARAEARLYEFEQEYVSLQSDLVESELRLRNLLNLPPSGGPRLVAATDPTAQRFPLDPNGAFQQAMDSRPSVVRQRLNVAIRRLELLVATNQKKPDLDFSALYRLNGLGDDLGDALDQMAGAEFADVELGLTYKTPIGQRQARAFARAARQVLRRDSRLLQQELFSVSHELRESSQRIEFAYREYEKAQQQLEAAREWVDGAQMRYLNPPPESSTRNWMLQYLDDYYRAIRSRTDAAIGVARAVTDYNVEIVRFEEIKGTLLEFFAVEYAADPCLQAAYLPPILVDASSPSFDAYWGHEATLHGMPAPPKNGNAAGSQQQGLEVDRPARLGLQTPLSYQPQ